LLESFRSHLRTFEEAVAYPPNQVFIGNLDPDDLANVPSPWYKHPVRDGSRWGLFGEIMPEDEFYGMMKICDEFQLLLLEEGFVRDVAVKLRQHPLFSDADLLRLGNGVSLADIERQLADGVTLPMYDRGGRLVGCVRTGHEEDPNLTAEILMENLSVRASGALALRRQVAATGRAEAVDFLLGGGEEAVGDRYNRGGGNMAKAIGELCGCSRAGGADIKAFCSGTVHAIVVAAGLVASGIFSDVVVVAGGSFAKLGMKFQGHLRHDMPILEDVIAAVAVRVGRDDGKSPVIRLDSIGKHEIGSGSSQQAIFDKLIAQPLDRLGLKFTQIDKYATEMHNPEITEPQGSGNVPRTNYRIIGSFAVLRGEIQRADLDRFVEKHGMLGFSSTQGHIASAVPVLGHAVRKMMSGEMDNTMFVAKGSLFLGRMTQLADGMSFLLERNKGGV
jgi:betaine reductase